MLACGVDWSQAETSSLFELMSGKLQLVDLQTTKLEGSSDQVSSTRSVGMSLARRFNRGPRAGSPRGVLAPGSDHGGSPSRSDGRIRLSFHASLRRRGQILLTLPCL